MADENKSEKKGFTVGELEGKVKKYGTEISLCVIFVLSLIFTLIWGSGWAIWSIILCMIGAIVGALLPKHIHNGFASALRFATKDKIMSIVAAVIGVLLAVFISPIVFAIVGLAAGKTLILGIQNVHKDGSTHH